jgi:hypothetical protein
MWCHERERERERERESLFKLGCSFYSILKKEVNRGDYEQLLEMILSTFKGNDTVLLLLQPFTLYLLLKNEIMMHI